VAQTYFDTLETMSEAARKSYQLDSLRQAVARAYAHAPSARRILDQAGIQPGNIRNVTDLAGLPITRKNDLIELEKQMPFAGFLTIPKEDINRIFMTPGPIYEPLHTEAFPWFAKAFWAAGFRRGDVVANTFSYHMSPAGVLFHEAIRACGATTFPMGTGNTEILVQALRDLGVTGFVGTPSYLLGVIKKAEELGHPWTEFALKRAWFTGEMLSPSIRQTLESDYRVDTCQGYAVSEPGGCLAYECSTKHGLHLMDEYAVEIVDPATGQPTSPGETGEVVVTPLQNPTWGLLRFGTGDLSSLTSEPCPCGRTSPKLTGILGRVGDSAKVRGMFIVARPAEAVFALFPTISRAQIIVKRPAERDEMTFRLELKDETVGKAILEEELGKRFQALCLLRPDFIEFAPPGTIPAGAKIIVDERKWT
jgi:phenylacetate-CoA ligase